MKIQIRLFAAARQIVGQELIEVSCEDSTTVGDLRGILSDQFQPLRQLVPHSRFAVQSDYVGDSFPLQECHEVALIPPVSGG